MFRHVLKSPPLNKILEFQDQKKRLGNFYKKENFKPKIKVMTENLQDELNQWENKQAKGDIRWDLGGKKC